MIEVLRREIALPCPPERAFRVFIEQVDLWWPRGHRRFRDGALRFDGDLLVDRAADGRQWTMAEVLERVDPARLRLAWFPGSPGAPTDVEIGFEPHRDGTLVVIVHRPLTAAAAEVWASRVAIFEAGWQAVREALGRFVAAETRQSGG